MLPSETRLQVGQVLAERYWLQELLGRGAMGDVFRARHVRVPREFAVKVLHPHLLDDATEVSRFEREAELAGKLSHKNVIGVIDVGETARSRFLVMELATGPSLASVIADGPMDGARVLDLMMQICDGLHHAHERGLVHRDLKPENIIIERLDDKEVPRIVDFGLAILREQASGASEGRLTTQGIVVGTPHYMAPESALGRAVDRRADLFSIGVILYEMLTGKLPFDGEGVDIARANVAAPTPPMNVRVPGIDVDPLLEALTLRLLSKHPGARPPTADDVRGLLELIATDRDEAARLLGVDLSAPSSAGDAPTTTTLPGPEASIATDELEPLPTGRRRLAWAAALVMLLAVGVGTLVVATRGGDRPPAPSVAAPVAMTVEPIAQPTPVAITEVPVATPTAPTEPAVARRAPRTRPTPPLTTTAPASAEVATPAPPATEETAPASTDAVLRLYQALGRELKSIADRRDLAADDLWQQWRLIRINDALSSNAKRADAMKLLTAIDQELQRRFRAADKR